MAAQPPPERTAACPPPLAAALLDYRCHPGRYSIARKEPAILFASIRAVLQLAAGKSADIEHGSALQPAAAFFVRSALIHPGADHYTLLGVGRTSDAATLKEHYRLMMRLVHPDFSAGSGGAWPSDAATRLNQAYEVLSSPEKRARYDEELAGPTVMPRAAPLPRRHVAAAPRPAPTEPRVLVKRLAGGFGVLGLLGVVALVVAGGTDRENLIRATPTSMTAVLPLLLETPAADPQPIDTELPAASPGRVQEAPPLPGAPVRAARASPVITDAIVVLSEPAPVAQAPSPAAAPAPVAIAAVASAPPAVVAPMVKPNPGVTLAQAQPLLAALIQQVESGRGDRVLSLLDRDARDAPGARALSRQLDALFNGTRPVSLSNVEFRAEPAEGRLFVIGQLRFQPGDAGAAARRLALRVEFMARDGAVVMTGLSGLGDN